MSAFQPRQLEVRRAAFSQRRSSVCFRLGSAFGGERAFVGDAVLTLHAASSAGPVRQWLVFRTTACCRSPNMASADSVRQRAVFRTR